MSKSLIKLVDYSIYPAIVLIIAKSLGVLLFSRIFGYSFSLGKYINSIFEGNLEVPREDFIKIVSYSDLIMYAGMATLFSVVLVRALFFHESHIKPALMVKLADRNLLDIVKNSYEIYHLATVTLAYTWLSNLIIWINVANQSAFVWVGIATTLSSLILTTILLQDVYREVENIKNKPGSYLSL